MSTIEFVDQTLRDGQQSLWGMRMRAGHALPVAAAIDRVGYSVVDVTGSSQFEVQVRHHHDNPWEGLDLLRAAMPTATLRAGTRSNGIVGMGLTPYCMLDLWVTTLAKHGIDSFWIFDCLFNIDEMARMVGTVTGAGATASPQVMFGTSPVHTDAYFADKVAQLAAVEGVRSLLIGDEAGVLAVERAVGFLPAMVAAAGDVPLEMHFHNTTGLAPVNHLIGVEAGIRILHTAVESLANGPSMPSAANTADNLRRRGHAPDIDIAPLAGISTHFARVARAEGHPVGAPREYSVAVIDQQLPGGMTGTLRNQLVQYGMVHRLDEVLAEVTVVRAEMGFPIMATPYSQLVGIQALLNVVTGERYSMVPDENLMYLAGHMGPHPAPVDPDVLDKALGSERGRQFQRWTAPQPSLAEVRHAHGDTLSDEELILRFLMPDPDVDAMYAAGPVPQHLPVAETPGAELVVELMRSSKAAYVALDHGDVHLTLSRPSSSTM
jgi:oxaloacetate decarboxylase (Na+ extruding) subunit alpha